MIFWNFVKAWVRYQWAAANGYKLIATSAVMERRSKLCETCDFYNDGVCDRCGCLILSKTLLNTEKCPVGRWGALWIKKTDNPPASGD